MTSLSWYCTATNNNLQSNITIWVANVEQTAVTSPSPLTNTMVKVYEGNMTPVVGWNEFVFNQGSFAWDGNSNILICVQRNNGAWASGVNWQVGTQSFTAGAYKYSDTEGPYDMTSNSYSMTTSTTRANIIMKGGNREGVNRDVVVNFEDQQIPADWNNTSAYPWVVVSENGSYVMKSSNGGVASSTSTISATYDFTSGGTISFDALCMGEGTSTIWDKCIFAIDGEQQFSYGANVSGWNNYTYNVNPGSHTFTWTYSKDGSVNPTGDYFMVDNVNITGIGEPLPEPEADYSFGPVIENLPLRGGTYYLVASSTDPDFEVTINAEDMPCPDVEGYAFNPSPADDADGIEPNRVTLRWNIPSNATGWRLIFGSSYHPEPGHPQTIMYPEDGSFTTNLANSYTVRNLWNNTNYFWRVEFNNDGCPEGVSSPVWGFTTHLNIPQNLTAVDQTVFNDETIVLNWNAVADRTYRLYNVYRDGELIGSTQVNNINNTTYTDGPLAYNMTGYTYYVTAVYDEGESAPSNTVNVKVSGYGDVDGHVYEQDGETGIAGATVTMVGNDEFNVSHTYNFTTNAQGYYSGHIYAGSYNGSAAKEGYQTIYEPVQGNPVAIDYNQTTSPIDYVLDENFDPVCTVIAQYYPDSTDINAPYVKVYWGCGLPGEEIVEPFETGDFSLFDWQLDPTYPWVITTQNPYEGQYCMKSGNQQVLSSTSTMQVTVNIPADGVMSFFGKISCESGWDYGYFYIDGVQKGSYTGESNWSEKTFDITAGDHTFKWEYTEDFIISQGDDCFYVDYITFYRRPEPAIPGMTYDFEDSSMQGWSSLDADGDGFGWYVASEIMSTGYGYNGSNDCVLSQSYSNSYGALYPDNYLVSPQVALGGVVTFYACAQDANYAAEHFGVAVSTTSNNNPSAFTTLQEWTMTAKNGGEGGRPVKNSRSGRAQGNWYQYTVDLSAYAGQNGYVAIRHFNCTDMFYLDVDNITIGEPGKGAPSTRAFSHYRVYRTDCYNDGPYTEENTVVLACELQDTIYIDVSWPDAAPGVYKWGVGCVYSGNRGEEIAGPISWTEPIAVDASVDKAPNAGTAPTNMGNRAPWDLMMTFTAPEGGHYGVAYDGNNFYTSNWGYSSAAYNFYKYDLQGNMLEGFNISGCGTLRGVTYDGTYFYGVANSSTVYCVDLANHSVVSTFTSAYGAMRGITYDPERDGFWVIGNWSGNLTLIDRTGAIQFAGPAPTSASDLAYYKDENNVEHVFCFNNADNGVYDYNITTNTMGGSVFNFNSTPGATGSSGGCTVGYFNGKTVFIGDLQQSPNLIAIYELRDGGGTPGPGPTPGSNNPVQEERESEIVWSNCLDKDMYLSIADVTVLLNSADSPEGVTVSFTNYNEAEQAAYPIAPITLDETGFYAFDSFRRGAYRVTVELEGYEPIVDSINFIDYPNNLLTEMHLRYVMTEILYGVGDVYVSRTGWAMWDGQEIPAGPAGSGSSFNVDFEGGLPEGWTVIDANNDGYTWCLTSAIPTTWTYYASLTLDWYHGGTNAICSGSYINGVGALNPDEYLVSPQVTLAAGSQLSFWVAATDASYPADHFGVFVSDNGTSDWTSVQEWTLTGKSAGKSGDPRATRDGNGLRLGNWYNYTVDLSAYAGQKYIAFRHFNCYDQYIMCLDDIALTSGAKDGDRHLEYYKVMCTSIDGEPIYNANTVYPFCQVNTDELIEGEHYICKVAAVYSTGMSDWVEAEWEYESCEHYNGTVNGVTVDNNVVSWDYPGGGPVPPGPGQGDAFTVDFENSQIPAGWTVIDGGSPAGYGWQIGSTKLGGTGNGHNGSADLILSQSYDNNYGVVYPDNWFISPAVTLASGSTFSLWACGQDASYAAEHFGVFVSTTGTNPSDFTMVGEWTLTAKGDRYDGPRGNRTQGNWYQKTVDLSDFAGEGRYIAIRHFNCSDMFYLDVDDIELTAGAKGERAAWDLMMTFTAPEGGHYGVAYDGNNFYTSNWGYSSAAHNFYKYDLSGNMLEGFEIAGCGTLRGITYDGTNFYGVANSSTVYCVDLANHSVVSTFTSAYGAMRGITYDPERDGFWVIGNWSGNLTLIDRTGAIQQTGPAPTSASDLAYYKDENDVEHVYCFNNGTNDVEDWVIGNNTMSGSVFNFSSTPGFDGGSSGGCTVGSFNGKIAFIGDIQQSPNLIGVYELRDDNSGPTPPPTPSGDILGAMIFVDGEWEAFVPAPTNTYTYEGEGSEVCVRIVYNGTAELPSNNYYYAMSCEECEFLVPGPGTCEPGAPIHAEELHATDQIKVWWGDAPVPGMSEWLYYDDGTYATSIGVGGGVIYWASMFPAASIAPYAGTSLTKVALYENSYNTDQVTVSVYLGGSNAPQTMVSTMNYNPVGGDAFHEVTLSTPVAIDGTQNLWIVFSENGTYPANACADTGDPNNRWVSLDGSDWMDVASAGVPGYGWMIRGFVTNEGKGGMVENIAIEPVPAKPVTGNMTLSHTEVVSKPADLSFMNRSEIVKYNVYRSTDNSNYSMIAEVAAVAGQTYYEYIDTPAGAGTYYYQVRADYGDCESEPAQAADDPSHNYVTASVDAIGENGDEVALFPNPTSGNVTIQALGMSRITVVSVLGQVVYDTELNADEVVLNLGQFNAGMYMVRVYTENGVTVKRVTVMQ